MSIHLLLTLKLTVMERIILFFVVCLAVASCTNGSSSSAQDEIDSLVQAMRTDRELMEKYQMVTATVETECIDVHFMKGESQFFDVSVLSKNSKSVDIDFYKVKDISPQGQVKKGKIPCRKFMIFLPEEEVLRSWGYGGIDLQRADGSYHHIDFNLVDQP